MRQLITRGVVILFLCALVAGSAQAGSGGDRASIYLIAATPAQSDAPRWYPARIYARGGKNQLVLVRQFFAASEQFRAFADDLHGRMYLAGNKGIFIVHQDDPTREDFVQLENFDDFPCWAAIHGDQVVPAVQYCGPQIQRVLATAPPGQHRVGPGDWLLFRHMQYGGENGGPFQMQPPLAEIAGSNLVMPYSIRPEVVLTQVPSELAASPEKRRTAVILAATDRYLALWVVPDTMTDHSVSTSNLDHAEPLRVFLLDRLSSRWRTLELRTAVTNITRPAVRIFGDWLVTTNMEWRPAPAGSGSGSPGMENERAAGSNSAMPGIREQYYNQFLDLYVPGKLLLQNLSDGRKVTLQTDQEDSEMLAIRADGQILYRINESIYEAQIADSQIKAPTLIAKDKNVPDVHWAFWGPAAKSGKPVPDSRRVQ